MSAGASPATSWENPTWRPPCSRARKSQASPLNEEELFHIFRMPGIQTKKTYELTMEECIGLIRHAGGVPTLAHPCEYRASGKVMEKFARLGGEATEVCKYRYKLKMPGISALDIGDRIAAERRMNVETIALARKHGLKLTASSDYHGKIGEPGMETDDYGIDIAGCKNNIRVYLVQAASQISQSSA